MEWLAQMLEATGDVWALRMPAALAAEPDGGFTIAVRVALLAAVSTMLGHAVVFAINRVSPLRTMIGLAIGAVMMVIVRLITASVLAGVVWLIGDGTIDPVRVVVVNMLALAPHALGVLVFIPHLGLGIGRLLEGWSALALVALVGNAFGLTGWWALGVGLGSWFLGAVLSRALARPLSTLASRLWSSRSGHPTILPIRDVFTGNPVIPVQSRAEQPA